MKVLIVEDDFTSRRLLQKILSDYADCDVAIDGEEAVDAFMLSWEDKEPYDIIFLDIMLPQMDGQQALRKIREIEKEKGIRGSEEVKVIMTTALGDPKSVFEAFRKGGATGYIVKPITKNKILDELKKLNMIK